jgi:hypothetical protein
MKTQKTLALRDGNPNLSRRDRQLLNRLVKLKQARDAKDMETRHEMGKLLNERLGPPTERQNYGEAILKQAAKRLQISVSELNRMRWFAHLFSDFAALRTARPAIRSWMQFKAALPSLKPRKGGAAKQTPSVNRNRSAFRGGCKSLDNACKYLRQVDPSTVDGATSSLLGPLRELAGVTDRFSIRMTIVEVAPNGKGSRNVALPSRRKTAGRL